RHEIGPLVPLRRPRAGVRAAPLAGPESGLLGGGRTWVEAHVLGLGRHDGAAGTAVDTGREHGRVEPAVEAGVLGLHGAQTALGVGVHALRIAQPTGPGWRESDC